MGDISAGPFMPLWVCSIPLNPAAHICKCVLLAGGALARCEAWSQEEGTVTAASEESL